MNLQTERIDKHKAQFTIEIEADRLEDAKLKAARKISRQVRIKGFRKGRAPYRLVAQYVGEAAILEEAVEDLGDNLYKQALEESQVLPYGPGAFEDFKLEPAPTFIFSVPLQPEVDLQDYRSVRLDFEAPAVSQADIDAALRQLQMSAVEVLDDDVQVAALGNRVTIAVDSEFADGEPPEVADAGELQEAAEDALTAEGDAPADDAEDTNAPVIPRKGDAFVQDDNTVMILDPNEDPFIQGFVEQLVGVEVGSDVTFELTIPDDDADETIIGRRVSFVVTIKNIEAIDIPELDDDFARRACRSRGDEETDLAGLRALMKADLERSEQEAAKSEYADSVLQRIVEGAAIQYPEMMLDEQIEGMIEDFAGNLQRQRVSLDDYLRMTNTSRDDLREQYREPAIGSLRQSLVLRELVDAQGIEVAEEEIEARIETRIENVFAGYAAGDAMRKVFNTPEMKDSVRNELMMRRIHAHLFAIGQGEDGAAAVAELKAQMAADAQRARERSERAQRYQAEDAAAASPEPAEDAAENSSEPQISRDDAAATQAGLADEASPDTGHEAKSE